MTPDKQAEELMRLATKAGIALALISPAIAAPPPGYCEVVVCNKLERFSLSPWTHMKDKIGEACFPAVVGKEEELLLSLDLVDLANGDSDDVQPQTMVWTDDGDPSVTLEANGETLLKLAVEPAIEAKE